MDKNKNEDDYIILSPGSLGGKSISVNLLELYGFENMTNEQIVNQIKTIIKVKEILKEVVSIKEILEKVNALNNLNLSEVNKTYILNNLDQA